MRTIIQDPVWQEVMWQRPFEFQSVLELVTHLATLQPRSAVVWEIRSCAGKIQYFIGTSKKDKQQIKSVISAHGNVDFMDIKPTVRKEISLAKSLQITQPILSLKINENLAVTRAVLAAMNQIEGKDTAVVQIILGRAFSPTDMPNKISDPHASLFSVIAGNVPPASSESRTSIREKISCHRLSCCVRIGAAGKTGTKEDLYTRNIFSALRVMESSGVKMKLLSLKAAFFNEVNIPWHYQLKLSVKEVANLFLLPSGEENLPGVIGLHPKYLPAPLWLENPTSNLKRSFGINISPAYAQQPNANAKLLNISPRDSLEHTLILGPTGSGKSNVMLQLILEDILTGRSVLVIDPKFDLINDVLCRIPDERKDDVVVIDPSDACPVGFNPFNYSIHQSPELIADAILAVFKDIFADTWGIRSQDILTGALLTLAQTENASLLMLPPLLTNDDFRQRITGGINDKIGLQPFWNSFQAMSKGERNQNIAPVLNKMRQFLLRPALRNVLGQSSPKFTLSDLFYKRKIVLVPLNKGVIGAESAQLLGSLIVGLTWTLALSRAKLPPQRRHIVSIYIDELQDYLRLPTDLSDALAQARGLGVGITVAHQYRNQLPAALKAGIDANTHNKIIFGLNAGDAKEMAAMALELDTSDFMLLPRYHVYASLLADGRQTGWISGKTFPPTPDVNNAAELRALSMQRYGKAVSEIEQEYLDILGYSKETSDLEDYPNIGRIKRHKNDDKSS